VGNAISRGNAELEVVLDRKIRRVSLPEAIREEFLAHLGSGDTAPDEGDSRRAAHMDIRRQAVRAARREVHAMRTSAEIGDDAFHLIEEELDWIEMAEGGRED